MPPSRLRGRTAGRTRAAARPAARSPRAAGSGRQPSSSSTRASGQRVQHERAPRWETIRSRSPQTSSTGQPIAREVERRRVSSGSSRRPVAQQPARPSPGRRWWRGERADHRGVRRAGLREREPPVDLADRALQHDGAGSAAGSASRRAHERVALDDLEPARHVEPGRRDRHDAGERQVGPLGRAAARPAAERVAGQRRPARPRVARRAPRRRRRRTAAASARPRARRPRRSPGRSTAMARRSARGRARPAAAATCRRSRPSRGRARAPARPPRARARASRSRRLEPMLEQRLQRVVGFAVLPRSPAGARARAHDGAHQRGSPRTRGSC